MNCSIYVQWYVIRLIIMHQQRELILGFQVVEAPFSHCLGEAQRESRRDLNLEQQAHSKFKFI